MTTRRRRRPITLLGLCIAVLIGGALALAPRPSLSLSREMHVDSDAPLVSRVLSAARGAPDTLDARNEHTAEFRMIGVSWDGPEKHDVRIRTASNGVWSDWTDLGASDSGPDPGTREARASRSASEPKWVGKADAYEVQAPPDMTGLRVQLVRETGPRLHLNTTSPTAKAAAPLPPINSRAAWGARPPKVAPSYDHVQMAFVHHTVNSNTYAPGDVPAILRAIQSYHMDSNGWDDIGYNFLVDRFGGIWEGRAGGIDRPVVGAHVLGFNSGSTGVAVLGDFGSVAPSGQAVQAVGQLLAWKLSLSNVDPMGTNRFVSGDSSGGAKYPAGSVATLNNISGHMDANFTDCPAHLEDYLPTVRSVAKSWWGAFLAYPPGFRGGMYVASGEFTGDSVNEVVTGAGAGGGPDVEVFSANGSHIGGFWAFPPGFGGGVRVAAGNVGPGNSPAIVAAAGPGGGPDVEKFKPNGQNLGGFYAYGPNFGGGVFVATGHLNALLGDEIVTGADAGGGPHVRVFASNGTALSGFFAYAPDFHGGVRVATGDFNGDGVDEIVTAPGPGGGPHIRVFRADGTPTGPGFFAYGPNFTGGVYVTTVKSPDGKLHWIVTGAGEGGGTHVRVFNDKGQLGADGFFYGPPGDTSGVRLAGGSFVGTVPGQLVIGEGPGSLPLVGYRRLEGTAFFP